MAIFIQLNALKKPIYVAQYRSNAFIFKKVFLNSNIIFYRWRRDRLPTPIFLGFPCGSAGKESTCNTGDLGLIPGLGRSPGEEKGYQLQYSGLENLMGFIVHGVANSWTWLSDFHTDTHHILLHMSLHVIFPFLYWWLFRLFLISCYYQCYYIPMAI